MCILISHRAHTLYTFLRLARRSLILLLSLSFFVGALAAQTGKEIENLQVLELGKPIEREFAGGQTHSYQVALVTGQFVHIVVEQRVIDVVVKLFDPDGKQVVEVDSSNGAQGPEHVFAIAKAAGSYLLELRSLEEDAPAGRYALKIEELRPATNRDVVRIDAEHAFNEADLLSDQASSESLKVVILKYDEALRLFHQIRDRRRQAATLNNLGVAYSSLGDKRKALVHYQRALSLSRAARDRLTEARALNNIGLAYNSLGDRPKAMRYLRQALLPARSSGDPGALGSVLNSIGLLYTSMGQMRRAVSYYSRALPLFRSIRDRFSMGATVSNLGYVHNLQGEKDEALARYSEAQELFKSIKDRKGESTALRGIGAVYLSVGEKEKALGFYSEARTILEEVGEPAGVAAIYNDLGLFHDTSGEQQLALDYLRRALLILQDIDERESEAVTLNNIAMVYDKTGDRRNALRYYKEALSLSQAVKNPGLEAQVLNNLGRHYDSSGEWPTAHRYYKRALRLFEAARNRSGEATTLNNIGLISGALRDWEIALSYYRPALSLFRSMGERDKEATVLNNMGVVYFESGDRRNALRRYQQALHLNRLAGNRAGEAGTLYNLATLARDEGNLTEAQRQIEAALDIINILRSNIAQQELRASYFATVQTHYEFYIDLLMRLHKRRPAEGFDAAALQASEHARARGLLELLREAGADIRRGVKPELLKRERELQQQLDAIAASRARQLVGRNTAARATATTREIEEHMAALGEVQAQIRQSDPRQAMLTQPMPLPLGAIRKELDQDTLFLEYSLGEERSYLWLISPTELKSFELPRRAEVMKATRGFYARMNRPENIYAEVEPMQTNALAPPGGRRIEREEADELAIGLSRMLLGPVASELGRKRLVIVADGALQYLPFAALPDPATLDQKAGGMKPLILQHEIVSLPSISTLVAMRAELAGRQPAPKDLAVLADPVFYADDERVERKAAGTRPGQQSGPTAAAGRLVDAVERLAAETSAQRDGNRLLRLKATRNEAESILKFVPPESALLALDFDASRALVASGQLSQYRYVHFATHGLIDSTHPELTAIILSLVDKNGQPQDGYLRAHEIYNLNLPAELVVLSACQTGLGKEVKGEGLIGMTRGFMYAGAARVVVSLWSVSDEATAELMVRFYRGMLKNGKPPAEALRAAQIEMLSQERWRAPHYWGAFILQGEWK